MSLSKKWIKGVLAVRHASLELKRVRAQTSKGPGWHKGPIVYDAIHKATRANKRLLRLAQKRLAALCRMLPALGLVMTDVRLDDGTAIFRFDGRNYVLNDFHMESFRKDQFHEFGVDGGPWPANDLQFNKREKRLAETSFRLSRAPTSLTVIDRPLDVEKAYWMYREEAIKQYRREAHGYDDVLLTIPAELLWYVEFCRPSAVLVLFYSAEFRGLPIEIKKMIIRMLGYWQFM
jgi:hypothetical protein